MKRLTESPIPEPRKYDERFCSGKRVHLLRQAYAARNPPPPKEEGWIPWWRNVPWGNGTSLAVPTKRRRSNSMIARACNAQEKKWWRDTHYCWVHVDIPGCKPWKLQKQPVGYDKALRLFKPKDMSSK